ncbi:MAG TPA: MFS transporter [Usitatibacter sp.]|nr:MFS transporter [Usitatibacter sp.]
MPLALLVLTTVLAHVAFNGSRLTISLTALAMGATPLTVGVIMSLFAALPMALGIYAGRLVDRIGVRVPMIAAVSLLMASVVLPGLAPGLPPLFFAAAGAGSGFMMVHISVQHWIGQSSTPENRKDNFSWLALGFSISNFIGPTSAGFSIDLLGSARTFQLLALSALGALAVLLSQRKRLSHTPRRPRGGEDHSTLELLRNEELRRVFIVTGLLASAWDLFVFVMPIYGTSIGLHASTIGLILGSFAAATFSIRLVLPWLQARVPEWPLITGTFAIACVAYALFPTVRTVPLLSTIAFILGLGLGATQPSIMSLIYATAPSGRAGEAVGVRTVVLNASHTVLPLAFGGLGTALGMTPVFLSMSVALAGGGWMANRRRLARPGG